MQSGDCIWLDWLDMAQPGHWHPMASMLSAILDRSFTMVVGGCWEKYGEMNGKCAGKEISFIVQVVNDLGDGQLRSKPAEMLAPLSQVGKGGLWRCRFHPALCRIIDNGIHVGITM